VRNKRRDSTPRDQLREDGQEIAADLAYSLATFRYFGRGAVRFQPSLSIDRTHGCL
jgi:hypothetical protein